MRPPGPRCADRPRMIVMLSIQFAIACGALAETLEVSRLLFAGIAMPTLGLRLTLFVVYGLLAAGAYLIARGVARRLEVASALFAIAVLLPWANFDILPAAGSFASIAGSFGVAAVAAGLGWGLASFPRVSLAAILLVATVVNYSKGTAASPDESAPMSATGKPNLLVILVDTLRADHLGVYGYDRPTSPRMDTLASQGVRFDRVVAQASWTKPSVASLFTGHYVHDHGVIRSLDALGDEIPTLAQLLDEAGYRTVAFSANPWITPEFRFSRGFDEFESGRAMGAQLTNLYRSVRRGESLLNRTGVRLPISQWVFRWAGRGNSGNAERDEAQAASVVNWLATVDRGLPFFLYVHMIGPHDPYDPPEEFSKAFARSSTKAPRLPPPRVQTVFERAAELAPADLERLVDQYDGAIAHVDSLVGRMLEQLADSGLSDETIVMLTSDHGEEFYEHGNWRHGNQVYDEVVRVPLLIRVPGGERGKVRHDPAMLVDILPTALGLLGIDAGERVAGLDGRALFPEPPSTDQVTLSEHWWFAGGKYVAQAVSHGGGKFHRTVDEVQGRESEEFYDLREDSGERNNLIGTGRTDEADLATFRGLLSELGGDGVSDGRDTLDAIDPTTRERLRRLGYFDEETRK